MNNTNLEITVDGYVPLDVAKYYIKKTFSIN